LKESYLTTVAYLQVTDKSRCGREAIAMAAE